MELKSVRLRPWSPEFREVKKLLNSEIPEDERESMLALRFGTLSKDKACVCFFDGDRIAGFFYILLTGKAVFLLYLVVNPEIQSRGYGSAILGELKKRYPDYQIDIHIEIPEAPESKEEQAAKRYRFYQRNGFRYTGWISEDSLVRYLVLSNKGPAFDTEPHKRFLADGEKITEAGFNPWDNAAH